MPRVVIAPTPLATTASASWPTVTIFVVPIRFITPPALVAPKAATPFVLTPASSAANDESDPFTARPGESLLIVRMVVPPVSTMLPPVSASTAAALIPRVAMTEPPVRVTFPPLSACTAGVPSTVVEIGPGPWVSAQLITAPFPDAWTAAFAVVVVNSYGPETSQMSGERATTLTPGLFCVPGLEAVQSARALAEASIERLVDASSQIRRQLVADRARPLAVRQRIHRERNRSRSLRESTTTLTPVEPPIPIPITVSIWQYPHAHSSQGRKRGAEEVIDLARRHEPSALGNHSEHPAELGTGCVPSVSSRACTPDFYLKGAVQGRNRPNLIRPRCLARPSPTKPIIIITQVEGSGTGGGSPKVALPEVATRIALCSPPLSSLKLETEPGGKKNELKPSVKSKFNTYSAPGAVAKV